MAKQGIVKRVLSKMKHDGERDARQNVLEELFYDFHRSRAEIYKMNFFRGIFFGLGSVLGGTVLIALMIWILSFFVQVPWIGGPAEQVQETLQNR